jgi:hypothetical protein
MVEFVNTFCTKRQRQPDGAVWCSGKAEIVREVLPRHLAGWTEENNKKTIRIADDPSEIRRQNPP